ncbi:uncharacterized protein LOC142888936, partial [Nelusetta ayraudi]|uniref:uncharacterized protein LOC142888936 n=1 Tax=Nelusetta ayraudi TaxID=303726 RepID=UPI003F71E748
MCDCFHLAFPNWHAASSGTGAGRRLRAPEPGTEDDSICDEPSQFAEGERPRPQGSSPVEEYPEKYSDSDKECAAEHDPQYKSGKKMKKSGFGSIFEKHSTPKMSKLKEAHSPESGVIVKTAKDGCAEGLVYGGGGRDGIFIKEVVPESPASKSLKLKEGDQVLSATVYFDNMSYEDAIQILEHAQAYKVKLCLKRNPEIKETDPATQSDVIHEEELSAPEMREQRKSKRRSDARISWPKFSSLGRGRKSHFTRSHSSSEADEQRKLELSPTTSDTESPIKSQDALKGKKRHKNKLSILTKRGRISSSEDQDTDTPTAGQISGEILQTNEVPDMVQDEGLESTWRKEHAVYITEGLKIQEDLQLEQKDQNLGEPQVTQHKAELITIDSTLKTADLTVAMEDKENSTGVKSPGEKKKKKERSELKMKVLGKDKSHKKDTKAKSSPKRLKTIGASIEKPDMPKPGSDIQSLESHDLLIDVNTTNTTGGQSTKSDTMEIHYPQGKLDMSDGLSKASLSKVHLPKRDEIEIPGMEDMSARSTAKGIQEPKAQSMGLYEENHSETVQLSIDVDSVKEAVSKLPGYKLPKMDTSGVPIPEEITVIDANAQRISVKTPTKVVHTTEKEETHLTKFDMISSSETSKTTVKLPKITQSHKIIEIEAHKRGDIVIPGKESKQGREEISPKKSDKKSKKAKTKTDCFGMTKPDIKIPDIGIDLPRQNIMKEKTEGGATSIPDIQSFQSEMEGKIEGVISDVKIPEIDCIEYIDSEGGSPAKKDGMLIGIAVSADGTKPNDNTISDSSREGSKFKVPSLDIEVKNDGERTDLPDTGTTLGSVSVARPDQMMKDEKADIEFKPLKSEGELDKKGKKFKMPKFGIKKSKIKGTEIDGTLSKDRGTVKLPDDKSEGKISEAAETDVIIPGNTDAKESQEKERHKSKFKMPKLKISMPKAQKDGELKISGTDRKNTTEVELKAPELKDTEDELLLKMPTTAELDHKESKLSIQKIDIQAPKFIEPELDVKIEEDIIEVELPDVGDREHIHEIDVEESPSKFKIPTYKLPKFAVLAHVEEEDVSKDVKAGEEIKMTAKQLAVNIDVPSFEASLMDVKRTEIEGEKGDTKKNVKVSKTDEYVSNKDTVLTLPQSGVEVTMPEFNLRKVDTEISKTKEIHEYSKTVGERNSYDLKFNIPTFGITDSTLPKSKYQHELSITKGDEDAAVPEDNAGRVPDAELTECLAEVQIKLSDITTLASGESPSKFEMPTFKIPKFGIATPSVSVEVADLDKDKKRAELSIPEEEIKVDVKPPKIEMETEHEGKGSKFKMRSLGFSVPQVKKPDIDLSLSQKDTEVTIPEAKVEVTLPDVELKQPSADIEIVAPDIQTTTKIREGSPLKFKMPTFKLPKFGIAIPTSSVEVRGLDKGEKIDKVEFNVPEEELPVGIKPPKIELEAPSIQIKTIESEREGKGSKFKMPSLGFGVPQVKKPDIDLSLSQKDVEVTVPEAKAEVTLPDVELKQPSADIEIMAPEIQITTKTKEGPPSKFKMPTFQLPKFGIATPSASVEVPDLDKGEEIGKIEVNIPEEELTVDIKPPKIEMEVPTIQMKTIDTEHEGKGSKFKMPGLGFGVPQVKKPDIDLSLSQKDVEVTIPQAKAEVTLPDVELKQPSADIKMKAPGIQITTKAKEGSPSKFKMPTFKLPKFGIGTPSGSVEVSGLDKGEKIGKVEVNIPDEELTVDIKPPKIEMEVPTIQMKTMKIEHEGKGSKFKMPGLGFGAPQVKKPDIDLSLSQKDVEVTIPEAKAEVTLPDVELKQPSADIEFMAPEMQITTKTKEGPPPKFKMPTFQVPKFGIATPSASVELPDFDKGEKIGKIEVNIPEEELRVDIKPPKTDMEVPSIQMKTIDTEHEGKGSKFKMPGLGFGVPQVKKPDIDLSLSQKDVEVTVPEAKAEVTLPDVELKQPSADIEMKAPGIQITTKAKEGSPSKFKMPTFKLPKFGIGTPSASVEVPDLDKGEKIGKVEVNIPEEELTVDIKPPKIEMEAPTIQMKTMKIEHEGKGSKFKMPSLGFGVPQVKKPDIDLSLSQKDVEVTIPEAKAEVTLPDVELKQPSADIEIMAPEMQITTKTKEGPPPKFKMPTFQVPKFGIATPSASVEVPDLDKGEKIGKIEVNIPEEELTVD